MLLDSNILIYLRDSAVGSLVMHRLGSSRLHTCNIVVAEVLGYKYLTSTDMRYFERLFAAMKNHLFDEAVTTKTIELRRTYHIALPDAMIAATALVHNLTLCTHNTEDFAKITELKLYDPLSA